MSVLNTKSRKVFALKNFRGLDKENKQLKVATFRATDGKNFMIDSETLKTRPAFKYAKELPFFLNEGDFLIGWYQFREIEIFITRYNIYIGDKTLHEQKTAAKLITNVFKPPLGNVFDFDGREPVFREEKECLFIFGLGAVFVFAKLDAEKNVFYDLASKPNNPFSRTDLLYDAFVELPSAYEPTLFIGDNPFDDVNLLSRVSKYALFASIGKTVEGENIHYLPTHYDFDKHGRYEHRISFYKDRFAGIGVFPVFLGIDGENFAYAAGTHGTVLNAAAPFVIQDTFYPERSFEYDGTPETNTVISEIVGLTKEKFFNLTVRSLVKNAFEHSMEYIKQNIDTLPNANRCVIFSMPVEYTAMYRDANNYITKEQVELDTKTVYVMLSRLASTGIHFDDKEIIVSEQQTLPSTNTDYPPYPQTGFPEYPTPPHDEVVDVVEPVIKDFLDEWGNGGELLVDGGDFGDTQTDDLDFGSATSWIPGIRALLALVDKPQYYEVEVLESGKAGIYVLMTLEPNKEQLRVSWRAYFSGLDVDLPLSPTTFELNDSYYATDVADMEKIYVVTLDGETKIWQPHLLITLPASLEYSGYTQEYFEMKVREYLGSISEDFSDGDIAAVRGRLFERFNIFFIRDFNVAHPEDWFYSATHALNFPAYPTNSGPSKETAIVTTSGQFPDYSYGTMLYRAIRSAIWDIVPSMDEESGTAYALVRVKSYWIDVDTARDVYQTLAVPFHYEKEAITEQRRKQSMVLIAKLETGDRYDIENFYSFSFNRDANAFELKIKDYFYDFRNEPSIQVRITFEYNPDYGLVSANRFGTSFGSENRLFLAGHQDYPNIDRYNVSNDLLGNNVKNQSYELSYFPSRNYRVVGGKAAINGYVVATDSRLYVSKKEYPNDSKLFIRERILDEYGVVGYREYKTSVSVTPLNHHCFVRFNNDVLMLTKDGLYGIELSANVLTDERLLKLRSGFINTDLVDSITAADTQDIFILENNRYMYMFVGKSIYVADSRYVARNENDPLDNVSYEIVKWLSDNAFTKGVVTHNNINLIDGRGDIFYQLAFSDHDDVVERHENAFATHALDEGDSPNAFVFAQTFDAGVFGGDHAVMFYSGYKAIGIEDVDYTVSDDTVTVVNDYAFRDVVDGDKLYFLDVEEYIEIVVAGFADSERSAFTFSGTYTGGRVYRSIAGIPLYTTHKLVDGDDVYARLSPYKPTEILTVEDNLLASCLDNNDYFFETPGMQDVRIFKQAPVELWWFSAVTDFGNNLVEKTMFRANVYATKMDQQNIIKFGYKTMRRLRQLEQTEDINIHKLNLISRTKETDLSNPFSLEDVDFNVFSINTFREMGMSFPAKENNFLYMQMVIWGTGQIEINSIELIYKQNRLLKTIG